MSTRRSAFSLYAWLFVVYLAYVILFGAWVRITGSGAGCGSHWPTCNGEIIPLTTSVKTMIEYSHRLTSGLLGILGLVLILWASRQGRRVFVASVVTMTFIIIEALVGAGLVLRELVADDDSWARALVVAFHLVNTLVLMAAATLTAWWSTDRRRLGRPSNGLWWLLVGMLVALVATSMTGAVTALGDTLFPVHPTEGAGLFAHIRTELSTANHFLVRLRVVHPFVAVGAAGFIMVGVGWVSEEFDRTTSRFAFGLRHAVITQLVIGLINIGLAAPGWMQLVHLLVAQVVWVAAVLLFVSASAAVGPDRAE